MLKELKLKIQRMSEDIAEIQGRLDRAGAELSPDIAEKAQMFDEKSIPYRWRYVKGEGTACGNCGKTWDAHPKAKYCPFCGSAHKWT